MPESDTSSLPSLVSEPALIYSGESTGVSEHEYNIYPGVTAPPSHKVPFWRELLVYLRPSFVLDHLSYNDFKKVFRTWIQIFTGVVLCVVPKTSEWFGSATYLLQIFGFLYISGGKLVYQSLQDNIICMFVVVTGWIFQILSLLIANRIHGSITRQQLIDSLIDEGSCTRENMTLCLSSQVFSGRYITTKTLVIHIFGLIFGMIYLGILNYKVPRAAYIVGTITMIVNSCYSLFYPIFEPLQIMESVLKPAGIGSVISFACAMVLFPQTTNFQYLNGMIGILKGLKTESTNNLKFFKSVKPSEAGFINYKAYKTKLQTLKKNILALDIHLEALRREVSFGRLDRDQIRSFRALVRALLNASSCYEYLYELIQERKDWADNKLTRRVSVVSNGKVASHGDSKFFTTIHEHYKNVGQYENRKRVALLKKKILNLGFQNGVPSQDLDYLTSLIRDRFGYFLEIIDDSLDGIIKWLELANEFRVYSLLPGKWSRYREAQRQANTEITNIKDKITVEMEILLDATELEAFVRQSSFNEETLLCLVNELTIFLHMCKVYSTHVVRVVDLFLVIDKERPTPRIVGFWNRGEVVEGDVGILYKPTHEKVTKADISTFLNSDIEGRDPDANPASNGFHVVGKYYLKAYKLLSHRKLWFVIKCGVLVALAALPYFIRTTAHWYYSNRLNWVVVMTGLSLNETTGQTVYTFGSKLVYSFFGTILGLICWYISRGNYYGYATVSGVVYLYLIYYRLFSKHYSILPPTLFAITTVLVLSTSFLDFTTKYGTNIGSGWRVAYTRFISVVIGLCIGFFACLIPKPHSSRADLRKLLSNIVSETGNIHCLVSKFALFKIQNPEYHLLLRGDPVLRAIRSNFAKISKISDLMTALNHEIPISGTWPSKKYEKLKETLHDITLLYYLLLSILDQVNDPEKWIPIMYHKMGWSNSALNGEFFGMLHMTSDSLLTRHELPKITELNLSVKHLEILTRRWGIAQNRLDEGFYKEMEITADDNEFHQSLITNIDFPKIFSHDGQLSTVSLILAHMLFERCDELMIIVKSLVGEKYDFNDSMLQEPDEDSNLL